MRDIVKPGVVLFVIALVAALSLSVVYEQTKDVIKANETSTQNKAMTKVLPEAKTFSEQVVTGHKIGILSYNEAKSGDAVCGYAILVATKGYGGVMKVLVGVNLDGTVSGVDIITHNETPGLGANAKKPQFTDQFKGQTGEFKVVKSKTLMLGEIEAITSSTITSKAVTGAVNEAVAFYQNELGGAKK